jgi:hypothetical protein
MPHNAKENAVLVLNILFTKKKNHCQQGRNGTLVERRKMCDAMGLIFSQIFIANTNVFHLIFHGVPFFDYQMNMMIAYLASK